MANEFKVKKGLIVQGSGSTVLDIQGSQGQLFSVTDSLVGSLFSVNDISGMPIMEVFSDDRVLLGTFGAEAIKVSGSTATVTGSLFGTSSYATQALSASWAPAPTNAFVQSGNSFGTTALLGTNDNQSLALETNGTTKMFISSSGNVGIGTTTPVAKLTVTTGTDTIYNDGALKVIGDISLNSANNLNPSLNRWTLRARANGVEGSFDIFDARNALSRLLIDTAGFVGIGTTSPGDKLEVNGNIFANGFNSIGTLTRYNSGGGVAMIGLAGNAYATIQAYSNAGGTGKSLAINPSGGNVGIGTTTPNARLDVSGSAIISGSLTVTGRITAEEFHTEFVSSSIIYQSGSTKFGDSSDDVMSVTGSLRVNGSITGSLLGTASYATTALNVVNNGVTSVATNNGITGGTITSTGTIGLATAYGDTINPYASKTANYVLAAPNGSAGVPSFRAIVAADIPTLNQNTSGNAATATTASYALTASYVGSIGTNISPNVDNYLLTATGGSTIQGESDLTFDGSTFTVNNAAFKQGNSTVATGAYSHAQGGNTSALGLRSHAEGYGTTASGSTSHAEGSGTQATGSFSHAEGSSTRTVGDYSHAEGAVTIASGSHSHAEGNYTAAQGNYSHAEGDQTVTIGNYSHTEGYFTTSSGGWSHAEGISSIALGNYSHAEGDSTVAQGYASHAEGRLTTAVGSRSHAEGSATSASGNYSHAEGNSTTSTGLYSHAEGYLSISSGSYSHAEGNTTIAIGAQSHTEGGSTVAFGIASHAEGSGTRAVGDASHAEGEYSHAGGRYSHAEGRFTSASGEGSHAEGEGAAALQTGSHAEGYYTIASGSYQHVQGQFNISSSAQSAFIIGNGTNVNNRSNLVFASGSIFQVTGSINATQGFTGSLFGTASWATSASNAASATAAKSFEVTANVSTNATYYPVFTSGISGNQIAQVDNATLTYNPSNNTLTATTFAGTATNATNIAIANTAANATYYPVFVSTTTGNLAATVNSTGLTYNPFSKILTTTASYATTATTATTATNVVGSANRVLFNNGTNTTTTDSNLTWNGTTFNVGGILTATVKSFIIDHPTKQGKKLQYGVLEGPEHSVYVRGKLTNNNTITLPDHWHALVHEDTITVNLTPIGKMQNLWVETVTDTAITVGSDNEINCYYTVFAERKDIEKLVTEFDK